jgi:hypothetical protein
MGSGICTYIRAREIGTRNLEGRLRRDEGGRRKEGGIKIDM